MAKDDSEAKGNDSQVNQRSPSGVGPATLTFGDWVNIVMWYMMMSDSDKTQRDRDTLAKVKGIIASEPWEGSDSSAGPTPEDQLRGTTDDM